MRAQPFDAVSLQILWNRLISAVDEASAILVRTAFSTIVRESHDFAIVVTDAKGQLLAQATQSIPSFIGTLPRTVRHFIDGFGLENIHRGDVLICNDPWQGTGHLPDVNLCSPIFFGETLVGFAASTAHVMDIGGRSGSLVMRDIFEEGLQIPRCKLVSAGEVDETLVSLLRANVRAPDQVVGDLWAQMTSLDVVSQRVADLMAEYGLDDLEELGREILDRSESAMRSAIREIPEGTYRYTVTPDGLTEPFEVNMVVTLKDGSCQVDFEDVPPQMDGTSLNVVYAYTFAYTVYGLKCVLAPELPNNEGLLRPISMIVPEGSILNHKYPCAGFSRNMIGHHLPVASISALAQVAPERVMAPCGVATWAMHQTGTNDAGPYANLFFFNGGYGANCRHDGPNVLSWPSNISGVPVEITERLAPFRVEHKRLRADSGGAGRFRGGLGLEVALRVTETTPIEVHLQADRTRSVPEGILGGEAGAVGEIVVNGGQPLLQDRALKLKTGDALTLRTPGAGGYGSPQERDPDLIARDIEEGYVTAQKTEVR